MIYSYGLRRSEVTNIKLTDLDRERGILPEESDSGTESDRGFGCEVEWSEVRGLRYEV
jgi:hypothetical protein